MINVAVILGAGSGTRMKSEKSKMLLEIMGKTVIERSVAAFLEVSDVDEIIVVARESELPVYLEMFDDERITFVIGGDTRQQSVKNAVDTIDEADLIMIHDGARPFVKPSDIEKTIRAAKEYGAAALGVPVKDTIKVVDSDGFITDTPDRSTLMAAQTPQIFNFSAYRKALTVAEKDGMDFTDDCRLMEYSGQKVKLLTGDYSNIKITTPDDIAVAENIILNSIRKGK